MAKGRRREIVRPANWYYIYTGLQSNSITQEDAMNLTGLNLYSIRQLVKEEKLEEEKGLLQTGLAYEIIKQKYGFTNEDIDKFHVILKEVIEMNQEQGIGALLGRQAMEKSNKRKITSFFDRAEEDIKAEDGEKAEKYIR